MVTTSPSHTVSLVEGTPYYAGSFCRLYLIGGDEHLIAKCLRSEYAHVMLGRFTIEKHIVKTFACKQTPMYVNYDLGIDHAYYCYRYIRGMRLSSLLHMKNLQQREIIDISRQLLSVLSALHIGEMSIIHSDISPDNIIIDTRGKLHLIDFGCAHICNPKRNFAHTWIGKHAYLSPEQAQGKAWSFTSDVYQAGLIMYEMICGRRFNQGKGQRDQVPIAASPAPLGSHVTDVSFLAFLTHVLDPEPNNRPGNASIALSELNTI